MDTSYPARLSAQLVIEIKTAMARAGVTSTRALGRLVGESSQYMSMRLDGGNPRTGERVPLNVRDLAAIATALDIPASELVARAESSVRGVTMLPVLRAMSDPADTLLAVANDRDPRKEQEGRAD